MERTTEELKKDLEIAEQARKAALMNIEALKIEIQKKEKEIQGLNVIVATAQKEAEFNKNKAKELLEIVHNLKIFQSQLNAFSL